jgi:SAM-dependent methyltransferase
MATRIGGPVLELGCGTGRVTVPIAEDGHEVWGLDLSDTMLGQLRGKLERLPPAVAAKVHIVHGDMANFDLGRKFDLVVAPFRAFQALSGRADQERCLRQVAGHLSENGRFIMHVFRPKMIFDQTWVQPESFDWEVEDPRTRKLVRRYERRKRIDLERQVLYVDLIYRVQGSSEEIVEPLAVSYFYEEQIRALLLEQGLRIVEEFGYFDRRPIAGGPELIFECSLS